MVDLPNEAGALTMLARQQRLLTGRAHPLLLDPGEQREPVAQYAAQEQPNFAEKFPRD